MKVSEYRPWSQPVLINEQMSDTAEADLISAFAFLSKNEYDKIMNILENFKKTLLIYNLLIIILSQEGYTSGILVH